MEAEIDDVRLSALPTIRDLEKMTEEETLLEEEDTDEKAVGDKLGIESVMLEIKAARTEGKKKQ